MMEDIKWEAMQNLSELTIIVPTFNRQKYALKQMRFWSGSPVSLHVFDGSSQPIPEQELGGFDGNVQYHHMPCSLEERYRNAIAYMRTPYTSLLCDDEFFIPSALSHAVQYLMEHDGFVSCTGKLLAFHSSKKGLCGKALYMKPSSWKLGRLDSEDARERLLSHVFPWEEPMSYAVQTTDVLRNALDILSRYRFSTQYAHEIQEEFLICYQGKSMVLNELLLLKNKEVEAIRFIKEMKPMRMVEWMNNPLFHEEVQFFYSKTAGELARVMGYDAEKVFRDISEAMDVQMTHERDRFMLQYLVRNVPKPLRRILWMVEVELRWKPLLMEALMMQQNGILVDQGQLEAIRNIYIQ